MTSDTNECVQAVMDTNNQKRPNCAKSIGIIGRLVQEGGQYYLEIKKISDDSKLKPKKDQDSFNNQSLRGKRISAIKAHNIVNDSITDLVEQFGSEEAIKISIEAFRGGQDIEFKIENDVYVCKKEDKMLFAGTKKAQLSDLKLQKNHYQEQQQKPENIVEEPSGKGGFFGFCASR